MRGGSRDFCRACGASIPSRAGEGTCWECDPEGNSNHQEELSRRWVSQPRIKHYFGKKVKSGNKSTTVK